MNRRQFTRQMILGTFAVMLAALSALGLGSGARAADDGAFYVGGHGSKAGFQKYCKDAGGTFSEDGLGNTSCHYKQGGWEECDANGGDCWFTPYREDEPDHPFEPSDWGGGEVADDSTGSESPPPVADNSAPSSTQPSVAAPDGDQDQDTNTGKKSKKGKKGKKGGKGRNR